MVPSRRATKRPARRPKQVDAAFVDRVALSYLDRFDATEARLREVLLRRCRTTLRQAGPDERPTEAELQDWIAEVVQRFVLSGILDDRRYAENAAAGLRRRGASRRKIIVKLRLKGVPEVVIAEVLQTQNDDNPGSELEAAVALAKRRRLGPFRRGEDSGPERRRKDLAVLARAGFSFEVAARALAPSGEEF